MSIRRCSNCQHALKPGDDICENCGAILAPAIADAASPAPLRACPNCKQPVRPDDELCEHCGMLLPTAASSLPSPISAHAAASPRCGTPHRSDARFCSTCGLNFAVEGANQPEMASQTVSTSRLPSGRVLNNRYKITKSIGAGGMGAVYLAEDQVLKRLVVIKTLLSSDDPDLAAQSVKEREFLATIKHANIITIYDFFTVDTDGYIVMEYVQGKTLLQIIEDQGRPMSPAEAIGFVLGILPAFTYLAKLELVYCDFKPQNVMLEQLKDGSSIVKLIDLGTVIHYGPNPDDIYGTAGFFAPEAVRAPSHETDLYSICRALAWMVSLMELDDPPFGMPPIERYVVFRDYPMLYRLLVRGTHPDPLRRFHSAEELGEQLAGVLRLIAGGKPGMPATSRLFAPGATATGRLAPRGEAALDAGDAALDLLRQGDLALRLGNYAVAQTYFSQAAQANPNSIDAYGRLTEALIEQGEIDQAREVLGKARRIGQPPWKIAWYTARLLEAESDLDGATKQYLAVSDDLPGELPPQQALARIRANQGDDTGAIELWSGVLRADPGNTDAILGMTTALLNAQRWDEVARVLSGVSDAAAKYVEAQLMLCDLFLNRMTPLSPQNVERAAQALNTLTGRTEDPRYYLARGDVYRAALQLARTKQLPASMTLPGVPNTRVRTLSEAAEESYIQYLRAAQNPLNRESIVRRRFAVAPWRIW